MERRLSAIFAADMVGYSRLMEADEVGTLQRQKAHRIELINPTFEEFHGRIVKEMGDGVLVEFPSVVEAVQCAVAIQREMVVREADEADNRRIAYRIGINLGDIVIEGDDIFGDGVNIAARLEQTADPGGICISGTAYDQLKSNVEVGYQSLGELQVKNIQHPIRAYKVLTDPDLAGEVIEEKRSGVIGIRQFLAIAAMLIIAIIGGGGWWWSQQPDFEPADPNKYAFKLPDKPSIAVLPFDNLSGNPDDDYLGDSLTETIIASLGTLPDMIVIARNSVFTYKGKPVKVQQVAEELGVKYVLEGSVHRDGDRIRIVAQLVNALDGKHLWAQKYDEEISNLFEVQDAISEKIAEELEYKLSFGDLARRWRQDSVSPEIYRSFRQINEWYQLWNLEGHRKTEAKLKELLKEFGDTASLHIWFSYLYWQKNLLGIDREHGENIKIARQHAEKARSIMGEDESSRLHIVLGNLDLSEGKHASAISHVNRSLELAPSVSSALAIGGFIKAWSGEPEESIKLLRLAMRLEPQYPTWYPTLLAEALAFVGRNDEAKATANAVLALKQDITEKQWMLGLLVKISASEGDIETAQQYAKRLLDKDPVATVSKLTRRYFRLKDQAFLADFKDALKEAGIPENLPPKLPKKPSIVVLPFANMSDDKEQEYFVDGMTDDLITRLANAGGLFVIARNTAFTYKGRSVKVQNVGRDLGVRYVLEGSVRRSGGKIRINAQLVDAKTDGHLWAEIFDRDASEIFALQDEVTAKIVEALKVELTPVEMKRIAHIPTRNMKAYDLFLKAREYHRNFHPFDGSLNNALKFYQAAISEDPNFADAYAYDADLSALVWQFQWSKVLPIPAAQKRTRQSLKRALGLDPENPIALLVKARLMSAEGHHADAISLAKNASALAPGDHRSHQRLALILAVSGALEEAIVEIEQSVRLNPNPKAEDTWVAAFTYFHTRQYKKSVAFSIQTTKSIPGSPIGYYSLAASYARLNQVEEANKAVDRILDIIPFDNWQLNLESTVYMQKDVQMHFVNALRDAGLPEWPYGFKADGMTKMLPDEQRKELWGKRWIGKTKPFGSFNTIMDANGNWKASYTDGGYDLSGSTVEVDGEICVIIDGSLNRPPSCRITYRNPKGTLEDMNGYITVHVYGISTFSVFD